MKKDILETLKSVGYPENVLAGKWFITIKTDGKISKQGMIVDKVFPEYILVWLCSWVTGDLNNMEIWHISCLTASRHGGSPKTIIFEDNAALQEYLKDRGDLI